MSAVDIVRGAGLMALEAYNADAAIRLLEARSDIRLVFTDIDMPGTMDGMKLARHIRDRWPPILLIVASGKAIIKESSLPDGALFFAKPYADHRIAETMLHLLGMEPRAATSLD
jgi:CheY-like chemotaxis protein